MTHADLVAIGARWLNKTCVMRCPVVLTEYMTTASERSDILGFRSDHTVMIEVKTSRADFYKDAKKCFRLMPETGVGSFRLYLCPTEIIRPDDLPPKWGLLYVDDTGKCSTAKEIFRGNVGSINENRFVEKNRDAERRIMYSALRRLAAKGLM